LQIRIIFTSYILHQRFSEIGQTFFVSKNWCYYSGGSKSYQRNDSLEWTKAEQQQGKVIKIKGFPAEHKVKVFREVLSAFGAAHGLCYY